MDLLIDKMLTVVNIFLKSLAGNMKGSIGFYSLLFCEETEQWLEGMEWNAYEVKAYGI